MSEAIEHPELFDEAAVRRIMARQQTQTRRIISARTCMRDGWPTSQKHLDELNLNSGKIRIDKGPSPAGNRGPYLHVPHKDTDWGTVHRVYPRVQPGDKLWVRETWSTDCLTVYPCPTCWYRADFGDYDDPRSEIEQDGTCAVHRPRVEFDDDDRMTTHPPKRHGDCFGCVAETTDGFRWRPSIHMPRKHCRLSLYVTAVRIERVREITPQDAWGSSRGCGCPKCREHDAAVRRLGIGLPGTWEELQARRQAWRACSGHRDAFAHAWDARYGGTEYSWRSNRHVLVYEFEMAHERLRRELAEQRRTG